ncbi:hypothetical protein F5051DRAFT_416583 [Lentinula edodes]|nr:hypothetical protein F5051DRAFT_416583 [Lentinula edodes]
MQSRLSGMSLYLKLCFIVILSVASVVALPVSGSGLVPRDVMAGPVNRHNNLGDPDIPWKIYITFLVPSKETEPVRTILSHQAEIESRIKSRINENSDITTSYETSVVPQLEHLLRGKSYEGDVGLKLAWYGPKDDFVSKGEITVNGKLGINVKFSLPRIPVEARFTVPV